MNAIKLVNPAWIKQQRTLADCTTPGEAKDAILSEIADAEKHVVARQEVVDLAKRQGFVPNRYDGKSVDGETVKAGCGFVRRNDAGKWITYDFVTVQEIVGHEGVA